MNLAQFRREARKAMKKNPRARRNHHLVVGERVKLSDAGIEYQVQEVIEAIGYSKAAKTRGDHDAPAGRARSALRTLRGRVLKVGRKGYTVRWDRTAEILRSETGNPDQTILWGARIWGTMSLPDKHVVSAESTSRRWPGNHYEGVDPMAKKNGRARRNMAIKRMPDGTILADTPAEMMEWMQLEAGSSFQQPKLEGPRLLKAGNLDGGYGARKLRGGKFAKLEKLQASLKYSKPLSLTYSTLMKLIGGTKARHALAGGKPPKSIQNRTVLMAHGVTPEMAHKFIHLTAKKVPGLLTAKTSARGTSYFALNQGFLGENPQLTATLFKSLQQAVVGARKNPKLGASPTIGFPEYYRQPTNAGPYTPQTFPYGYGGRPATYKTAKKNSIISPSKKGTVFYDGIYFDNLIDLMEYSNRGIGYYAMMEARTGQDTSEAVKEDVRLTLQEWTPREQREIKALLKLGTREGVWGLKAKKNSSSRRWNRYAIQAAHDFPGWAQRGPIEANWTSYPTYAYEQFARANGRGRAKRPVPKHIETTPRSAAEGLYALGKGPKWPIGDLFHARLALIYAMAPSNWSVHKRVLAAVKKAYPLYNWDKWWDSRMKKLRARGRKDKTLASKIEMAAANPAKLSALILKK